jgi:glycopeptide antibiotics resistance protein
MLRRLLLVGLLVYIALLGWVTLRPSDNPSVTNWVPLLDIVRTLRRSVDARSLSELLGNVVLFVPLGWFLPMLWRCLRSYAKVFAVAAACSATIELVQLVFVPGRSTSVDDVILNSIGGLIGAAMFFGPRAV